MKAASSARMIQCGGAPINTYRTTEAANEDKSNLR